MGTHPISYASFPCKYHLLPWGVGEGAFQYKYHLLQGAFPCKFHLLQKVLPALHFRISTDLLCAPRIPTLSMIYACLNVCFSPKTGRIPWGREGIPLAVVSQKFKKQMRRKKERGADESPDPPLVPERWPEIWGRGSWTKGTGVLGGMQLMKDRATASLEGFIVMRAPQTPAKQGWFVDNPREPHPVQWLLRMTYRTQPIAIVTARYKENQQEERVEVQRKLGASFQGCLGPGVEGGKDYKRARENLGIWWKRSVPWLWQKLSKCIQFYTCERKQFVVHKSPPQ